MKIAVTGSSGFVGSAVVRALRHQGREVRELRRASGDARSERYVDLRDPQILAQAFRGSEVVIHAASPSHSHLPKQELRDQIIAGTENVLTAARHVGVRRIVLVNCADITLAEEDRMYWDEKREPISKLVGARAEAMKLAEEIALALSDNEVEVVSLRPAWIWGEGDSSRLPLIKKEAQADAFRLYGNGENFFATAHIEHVVQATIASVDAEGVAGESFYLADADYRTSGEFFDRLATELGFSKPQRDLIPGMSKLKLKRSTDDAERERIAQRSYSTLFDVNKAVGKLKFDAKTSFDANMKRLGMWARARV